MNRIENEAPPLREEKRNHGKDINEQMFVWALIMLIALTEFVEVVFVILKLTKTVTWTWPVILMPTWVLIAISMSLATAAFVANNIERRSSKKCRKCAERGADHCFDDKGNMIYICQKCRNGKK